MTTQLQQYQFNTHQFRVIPDDNGEPWFVAKDVCDILGYANARDAISKTCRKSGVAKSYVPALSNTYNLINEGNLYRLIIKSNKPQSEPFENWVCDEILPSIRKTGGYQIDKPVDNTQLQTLTTENTQLKTQLAQQAEMLELYRFKANTLEQGTASTKPKRKAATPLTQNEINAIHALHQQGLSNVAIARQIGRSSASVSYIVRGAKAGVA